MSLLLWYPFTQDGYNRGAAEGNHFSPTINTTGILGKCGLANKVTLGTNLDLGGAYSPLNTSSTMTAWIKMDLDECKAVIANLTVNSTANTPTSCILGSTSYGGLGICWMSNNIYNGGNRAELSSIRVFGYTRGTGGQVTTSNKYITFGKWHHVALTADKETKKIAFYFDGTLISENSYSSLTAISTGRPFGLNRNQVYGGNGPGALLPIYYNDVRFYDEVLSVKEIKELSKGLMLHYTFNDIGSENTTNLITGLTKGGQTTVNSTLKTVTTSGVDADTYFYLKLSEAMVEGQTYTLQCYAENLPYGTYFRFPIAKQTNTSLPFYIYNGWNTYTFTANSVAASAGTSVLMDDNARTAWKNKCVFSCFQLEKKDHATAYVDGSRNNPCYDESGYGNDGNQNQIDYTSNSNNGSCCASFNGTHSYIELPNWKPSLPNDPYTIAFWVKSGEDKTRDVYFGNHANSSETFNIERTASNYLRVYYASDTPIGAINTITIPVNTWVHIVMTFDGTTFRAYKDGVEKYSKALTKTLNCTNTKWKIGSDYRTAVGTSEATRYKGLMSDFRIYASALTPAQVLELYESKAEIDKNQNVFTNEIIEQNEVANMVNLGSWEQGGVNDASGTNANNMNNRVRTKHIPVLPNTPYYFKVVTGWNIRGVHFYKKDNTWISYTTIGDAGVRTTPEDCYYVRFIVQNDTASLDALVADIATFGPVMVPGSTATTSGMAADTDVEVTKTYQIKTKDICENHDTGFFKDGTASGNNFYEI